MSSHPLVVTATPLTLLAPLFKRTAKTYGLPYVEPQWTEAAQELYETDQFKALEIWFLDTLWASPMRTIAKGYLRE